jgi:GT2 family glycosyltransferase
MFTNNKSIRYLSTLSTISGKPRSEIDEATMAFHIITYRDHSHVIECIKSIQETCIEPFAIYVLLNDASLDYAGEEFLLNASKELNFTLMASDHNLGLQAARNVLQAYSDADIYYRWAVFCDSDVVFKHKTWDGELDYIFDDDYHGKVLAGHRLAYPIQDGDHQDIDKETHGDTQVCQGYFMAFNPPMSSPFSEDFSFWCEDNDITLQALSDGYLVVQVPSHYMEHKCHKNQELNPAIYTENNIKDARALLHKKWYATGKFNYKK